jgi:hypothetical protein
VPEHDAECGGEGIGDREHHDRSEAGERDAAVLHQDRLHLVPEQPALVRRRPYVRSSPERAILGSAVEVVEADVLGRPGHADHSGSPQHGARHRKCDAERRNDQ